MSEKRTGNDELAIGQDVRAFITETIGWSGSPDQLTDDASLLENEVIDSLGIFQMVQFIEERFSVEVENEDLVVDNFETIASIARLVASKRSQGDSSSSSDDLGDHRSS